MIVVAIIALLVVIAIPGLLRYRVTANEASAQATLRTISTACEGYAAANDGDYPTNFTADLYNANPKYVNEDYLASANNPRQGYNFTCATMNSTGYVCAATPAVLNSTGTKSFSICTGGVIKNATGSTAPSCP
jgi:Tfp pilus assembly protein PilE